MDADSVKFAVNYSYFLLYMLQDLADWLVPRTVLQPITLSPSAASPPAVTVSKRVYMYMCPLSNGFRGRVISLYSSKIADKKEILRTVSNTGIYCSSDKVATVHLA
jgi:hypothetical protein